MGLKGVEYALAIDDEDTVIGSCDSLFVQVALALAIV
jgi:hypothetical protein